MKIQDFFEGLLLHKREEDMSEKTISEYRRIIEKILIPSIGDMELADFKLIDVGKIKLQGKLHGEFGGQRGVVVFRQLLQYLKKCEYPTPVDWRDIKVPKGPPNEVDWLEPEEWERVRGAFNINTMDGLRNRAFLEVARVTGMRIGEILALDRDSIDWQPIDWDKLKNENLPLKIRNVKPPHELQDIYFTYESLKWLKLYLDMRNDMFKPMFVSWQGLRVAQSTVRRGIHHAVQKAGIKKRVIPHLLRKTFVTDLLRNGADIKTVQILARHADAKTTLKHYSAVSKAWCREKHQEILANGFSSAPLKLFLEPSGKKVLTESELIDL